ncbi:MAG: hypothetical protein Kilf2KO_06420 [Rhodospirillales bacterium]
MSRALIPATCLVLAGLAPLASAQAGDWQLDAYADQRFEAETNRTLSQSSDPIYGSISTLGLGLVYDQQDLVWTLDSDVSGLYYVGPGDTAGLRRADPGVATALVYSQPRLTLESGGSFDIRPTAFTQVEDTGLTDEATAQLNTEAFAAASYDVDPRNQISLAGDASIIRFLDDVDSLTPTTIYGANARWDRLVNARTDANLSFGVRRFTADNEAASSSLIFNGSVGGGYRVSPRFWLMGQSGLNAIRTRQDEDSSRETDLSVGFSGNAEATWLATPRTDLTLEVSQSVEPSSFGELQNLSSAGLLVAHDVNSKTTLLLRTNYSRRASTGGYQDNDTNRQLFEVDPTVDLRLTQSWRAKLGYNLDLNRFQGESLVSNHTVFMGLSFNWDVIP